MTKDHSTDPTPNRHKRVNAEKINRVMRQLLAAICLCALLTGLSCSGRPPPPLPPLGAPSPPPVSPSPGDPSATPAGPAPELEVLIDPSLIREGDSAMLSWETTHADRVIINHNIGAVEPSGRIRLFPDETTSYEVFAEGSGGRVAKTVMVEVLTDETAHIEVEDLTDRPLKEQFEYFVKPVFFQYDSSDLSPAASLTLDRNVGWLTRPENLDIRFLIEGHCDQRGTEEYNLALGDRRAQTVLVYLVGQGLDPSRVRTLSLGEERPFDPNQTEEAWALNRRAHFVLIQ